VTEILRKLPVNIRLKFLGSVHVHTVSCLKLVRE